MAATVLVLTALEDVTADWVIAALNERGVPVVRADPADIGPELSFGFRLGAQGSGWQGRLRTPSRELDLERVGAVYYRRPTPYADRFRQLPPRQRAFAAAEARHGLGGVLNCLNGAAYVNHPAAVMRADFKPAQLQLASRLGLGIPATLVTNDVAAARAFAAEHPRVICKTFRGLPPGEDGHTGAIWAQRVDPATFDETLAVTAHLFQAEIDKCSDVRGTVVGHQVFAHRIQTPDGTVDWRRGDWRELTYTPVTVPMPVKTRLHRYLAHFHLVFACFDLALTGDADDPASWVFIEANPNGQWGFVPDAPAITEAFADILQGPGQGGSQS
ncbi:ATP-grasp ribosomal peptide maturase [Streptomyces sp. NPDC053474]|uniref:ATP-grasp ribosomal peptide maturase n=1 Tax=Streptomyces sp. NPDC053474 TaxID=3365704 RepID=UPI0037D6B273